VTLPDASQHAYDYRTRRIGRDEDGTATAVSWSGGVSLAEYGVASLQGAVADPLAPEVEHRRGTGGGVDEPPGSPEGSEPRAGGGDHRRRAGRGRGGRPIEPRRAQRSRIPCRSGLSRMARD